MVLRDTELPFVFPAHTYFLDKLPTRVYMYSGEGGGWIHFGWSSCLPPVCTLLVPSGVIFSGVHCVPCLFGWLQLEDEAILSCILYSKVTLA